MSEHHFKLDTYRRSLLGSYSFSCAPRIYAAKHEDMYQLISTTLHEKLHAQLASQTTHGITCKLGLGYCKNFAQNNRLLIANVEHLVDLGRPIYEALAVFGSLNFDPKLVALRSNLDLTYSAYYAEAESMIPDGLVNKRLGWLYLYAATLTVLSFPLPPVENTTTEITALLNAYNTSKDILKRWIALQQWTNSDTSQAIQYANDSVVALGLSQEYFQTSMTLLNNTMPLYSEVSEQQENDVVEILINNLSSVLDDQRVKVITPSRLLQHVSPYFKKLSPNIPEASSNYKQLDIPPHIYTSIYIDLHEHMEFEPLPSSLVCLRSRTPEKEISILEKLVKNKREDSRLLGILEYGFPNIYSPNNQIPFTNWDFAKLKN